MIIALIASPEVLLPILMKPWEKLIAWLLMPFTLGKRSASVVKSDLIGTRGSAITIGTRGTAITDLRPSGTVLFDDERIDVVSESEWITKGTPVKVISTEGNRHIVRSTADEEAKDA